MKKTKKIVIWMGVAMAIATGVFYGYQKFFSSSPEPSETTRLSSLQMRKTDNLGTVKVKRGDIVVTISSFGHVRANREVTLRFGTSGIVKKIEVKEGERVKKGQVLAMLDSPSQQAQLLQAKNNYEEAKLEGIKSKIEEKRLSYEAAYENYEKTLIKAPCDGEVTDIAVYEGDSVSSSTPIISLINRDRMYVDVDVDEVDIRKVAPGQEALVKFDAYPGLTLPAEVSEISPTAKSQGAVTVVKVTLELKEFDERIKPGFSTEAEIIVGKAENVLIIPIEAVVERQNRSFVTVITEDKPQVRPIMTGISNGEYVQVLSGLKEGEEIVANNYRLMEQFQKMAEEKGMGAIREMQMMRRIQRPPAGAGKVEYKYGKVEYK